MLTRLIMIISQYIQLSNHYVLHWFPGGASGKESACSAGDPGSVHGLERFPGARKWQFTLVFLPGKFHGWGILMGYSPWGHKESDTT